MKKIITLLMLFVFMVTNAQQFRISEVQRKDVIKLDKSSITYILLIEGTLNSNNSLLSDKKTTIANPSTSMLNNTLNKLSDKDKKKFESLVCVSCYENEWKLQQEQKENLLMSKDFKTTEVPNFKYIEYIRNLSSEDTPDVVNEILSLINVDYAVFRTQYNSFDELEYYILTKEQIEQIRKGEKELTDFEKELRKIKFTKRMEGENKALEIKGKEMYSFSTTTFNYLELFPYWQKRFVLDAKKEDVLKNFDLQKLRIKNSKIDWYYKFEPKNSNSQIWTLHRLY